MNGQFPHLEAQPGTAWAAWLGPSLDLMPELGRALHCLEALAAGWTTCTEPNETAGRNARKALLKFIGQSRCPSAATCEKLAIRTRFLKAWFENSVAQSTQTASQKQYTLTIASAGLERLIACCEGADDKSGVLLTAVRDFCRDWLQRIDTLIVSTSERAHWIYPLAMADQAAVIQPDWWWKALSHADSDTVLQLTEQEVTQLVQLHPSQVVNWKSYDQRWRRLRIKSLLSYLKETRILSELLRKSAVDDFEAAEALAVLQQAGRHREALVQGEEWLRRLPRSVVLGEAMYHLYRTDGWDEEALRILVQLHVQDPLDKWTDYLNTYHGVQRFDDLPQAV